MINQEQEENTNGAYGGRSQSIYRLDTGDTIRGGRSLDTPNRMTGMYGNHSNSSSRRHHHNFHHHHPYRKRAYLPWQFKKMKTPTFDGEIKKPKYAQAWFLGLKKSFIFHSYSEMMKAKITTFNLKGKADVWLEDVKNVKGIKEEDFIWDDFERIFKKK